MKMYLVEHQLYHATNLRETEWLSVLDSKPQTLTAKAHRPLMGTDGYFSKPSRIFTKKYML
jgi:hypothetical protein